MDTCTREGDGQTRQRKIALMERFCVNYEPTFLSCGNGYGIRDEVAELRTRDLLLNF